MFSNLNLKSSVLNSLLTVIASLLLLSAVKAQPQKPQMRIGDVEYFGTKGVDVQKVKTDLPMHEGEELSFDAVPDLISRGKASVRASIGREPTDLGPVCCDAHDKWIFYIGLPGRNVEVIRHNPQPKGATSFPPEVLTLYSQVMDLIGESVHTQAIEDRSQGYALSAYPPLRAKQLAMRDYATRHAALIRRVLNKSADPSQRSVAAQLMGYAIHNQAQILALVQASRDADETVRNNAIRALGVLAESRPSIAKQIPATGFVALLNSGVWTDRNKGGLLIEALTRTRDQKLLRSVSRRASDSLLEMAQWREFGHAQGARLILGRIAGIDEERLQRLAHDDPNAIIKAFASSQEE